MYFLQEKINSYKPCALPFHWSYYEKFHRIFMSITKCINDVYSHE